MLVFKKTALVSPGHGNASVIYIGDDLKVREALDVLCFSRLAGTSILESYFYQKTLEIAKRNQRHFPFFTPGTQNYKTVSDANSDIPLLDLSAH